MPAPKCLECEGWAPDVVYTIDGNKLAIEAPGDPDLHWVVVRESHLKGPWTYCKKLSRLVDGATLRATFPPEPKPGQAKVYVYEGPGRIAGATSPTKR